MKFLDLQQWPLGLVRLFEIKMAALPGNLESRYYGPYDAMLNRCFDTGDDTYRFFVAPQQPTANDFQVELIVRDNNGKPVLIVEIKDDAHNAIPSTRQSADHQVRARFDELLGQCPLPRLYAVSFLGTRMRVYCGDGEDDSVQPARVERPSQDRVLPPTFLQGAWALDVLSAEGFERMKTIVMDIRSMADGG